MESQPETIAEAPDLNEAAISKPGEHLSDLPSALPLPSQQNLFDFAPEREPEQMSLFESSPEIARIPEQMNLFDADIEAKPTQQNLFFSAAASSLTTRETPIPSRLSPDQQEALLNAVLMRGGATHLELLKMQYGEWPPHGLKTNHTASYEMIPIRDLLTDYPEFKDTVTTGLAGLDKDGIQTVWFKEGYRNFFSTGHEAQHIAQARTCTLPDCCQGLLVPFEENRVGATMDKIMAEAETPEQTAERRKLQFTPKEDGGMRNYRSQETETQAWMDNVFSHAFHDWGQLPTTKLELWAGLHAANIITPAPIMDVLQYTVEGQDAMKAFPKVSPFEGYKPYWDINDGFSFLPEKQQTAVWDEVFTRVYAAMIESYGDELGRERMGLGKSIASERAIALAIDHNDLKFDFEAAAKKIAPENAETLIERAEKKGMIAAADEITKHFPTAKRPTGESKPEKGAPIMMPAECESECATLSL